MELKIGDSVRLKKFDDLSLTLQASFSAKDKAEYNEIFAEKVFTICNVVITKLMPFYELKEDNDLTEFEQFIYEKTFGGRFTKAHVFTPEYFEEERIGEN